MTMTLVRPGDEEVVTLPNGRTVESARIPDGHVRVRETGCIIPDSPELIGQHAVSLADRRARHAALERPTTSDSQLKQARAAAEVNAEAARKATEVAERAMARIAELEARLSGKSGSDA